MNNADKIFQFRQTETNLILDIKMKAYESWMNAITRSIPFKTLESDCIIIAGGCFTSWLHGEYPKDIDIFVLDNEHAIRLAEERVKDVPADPAYDKSAAAINKKIKRVVNVEVGGMKYQWIFTKYKTRQELIDHFDFVHTKVSYDVAEGKLYLSPLVYCAIMKRELMSNGNNTIAQWRWNKFKNRGWKSVNLKAA